MPEVTNLSPSSAAAVLMAVEISGERLEVLARHFDQPAVDPALGRWRLAHLLAATAAYHDAIMHALDLDLPPAALIEHGADRVTVALLASLHAETASIARELAAAA